MSGSQANVHTDGLHGFDMGVAAAGARSWVSKYAVDFTTETPGDLTPDFGGTHVFNGKTWSLGSAGTVGTFEINAVDGLLFRANAQADVAVMDIRLTDLIADIDLEIDEIWIRTVAGFASGAARGRNGSMQLVYESDVALGNAAADHDQFLRVGLRNNTAVAAADQFVTAITGNANSTTAHGVTTIAEQLLSLNTKGASGYARQQLASAGVSPATPADVANAIGTSPNGLISMAFEEGFVQLVDNTEALQRLVFQANTNATENGFFVKSYEIFRFE